MPSKTPIRQAVQEPRLFRGEFSKAHKAGAWIPLLLWTALHRVWRSLLSFVHCPSHVTIQLHVLFWRHCGSDWLWIIWLVRTLAVKHKCFSVISLPTSALCKFLALQFLIRQPQSKGAQIIFRHLKKKKNAWSMHLKRMPLWEPVALILCLSNVL